MKSHQTIKNIKSQAGWTIWSMLFTMSVIGFSAYIVMKLIPIYNANSNVKNAMKISVREVDIKKVTRAQIIKGMRAQLYIDGGDYKIDYKKALKVTRDQNELVISVTYDRVVPLFANINILINFNPALKCELNGGCTEINLNAEEDG